MHIRFDRLKQLLEFPIELPILNHSKLIDAQNDNNAKKEELNKQQESVRYENIKQVVVSHTIPLIITKEQMKTFQGFEIERAW